MCYQGTYVFEYLLTDKNTVRPCACYAGGSTVSAITDLTVVHEGGSPPPPLALCGFPSPLLELGSGCRKNEDALGPLLIAGGVLLCCLLGSCCCCVDKCCCGKRASCAERDATPMDIYAYGQRQSTLEDPSKDDELWTPTPGRPGFDADEERSALTEIATTPDLHRAAAQAGYSIRPHSMVVQEDMVIEFGDLQAQPSSAPPAPSKEMYRPPAPPLSAPASLVVEIEEGDPTTAAAAVVWEYRLAKGDGEEDDDADEQESWACFDESAIADLEDAFAAGLQEVVLDFAEQERLVNLVSMMQEVTQEQEGSGGGRLHDNVVASAVRRRVAAVHR